MYPVLSTQVLASAPSPAFCNQIRNISGVLQQKLEKGKRTTEKDQKWPFQTWSLTSDGVTMSSPTLLPLRWGVKS